jgi:hypothetical protein
MDDTRHSGGAFYGAGPTGVADRRELPQLSNDERAFWRRAVEIERARQSRVRPAPFPYQDA